MKKIFFPMALFIAGVMFAGNENDNEKVNKYCAKIKDGKLVVMRNDKVLTSDLLLVDGTKIKMNGIIIQKGGDTTRLKDGECFINGRILKESAKTEQKHRCAH
jgi:hypothetical protein